MKIDADDAGYKITAKSGEPPIIEIDHSKARLRRLPSSGEIERFVVEAK